MNPSNPRSEAEFEEFLRFLFESPAEAIEALDDEGATFSESRTFEDMGILTTNAGVVVKLSNGAEFQVTIVQSAFADDDEEGN